MTRRHRRASTSNVDNKAARVAAGLKRTEEDERSSMTVAQDPNPSLLSDGARLPLLKRLSEISNVQSGDSSSNNADAMTTLDYSSTIMSDVSTDTGRKRKLSYSHSEQPKKHVRLSEIDVRKMNVRGYMAELNKDIWDAAEGIRFEIAKDSPDERQLKLKESQIGGTVWTADDKERFFNALTIYGRDDVVSIASAIGHGIGLVQVREYLTILNDASIEQKRKMGPRKWMRMRLQDQPAAIDISKALYHALDATAKRLEDRCLRQEEKDEVRKWGKYWLLNHDLAEQARRQYKHEDSESRQAALGLKQEDEDGDIYEVNGGQAVHHPTIGIKKENADDDKAHEPEIYQSIPSAKLLNLSNLLRLSRNIFMNLPQRKVRPWQYAGPAIRHTAFSDFHNLVVSVTRRVVSVVLFQAEIRLRNMMPKLSSEEHKRAVRAVDVYAALDILGMPTDLHEYWVRIPRKYDFQFATSKSFRVTQYDKQFGGRQLSFAEAEKLLQRPTAKTRYRLKHVSAPKASPITLGDDKDDTNTEVINHEHGNTSEDAEIIDAAITEKVYTSPENNFYEDQEEDEVGGLEESEEEDSDAPEMKILGLRKQNTMLPEHILSDDESQEYSADSEFDTAPDHTDASGDESPGGDSFDEAEIEMVEVEDNLIDPALLQQDSQAQHVMDDDQPYTASSQELKSSPDKRVRFAVEEEDVSELRDDGSDDDLIPREELLDVYPVAFDSSHVTTSRKVLNQQLKLVRDMLEQERQETEYLEARDQRQNEREEQRLWKVLQGEHTGLAFAYSKASEDTEEEVLKLGPRKALEWISGSSGDWRDHTEYVGEWERALMRPSR